MPILPPKVVHRDKAQKFLSVLATAQDESEYLALRKAITLQLGSAPTLLIFGTWVMGYQSQGGQWIGLILGGAIVALGIVGIATAQRLMGLLELFSPTLDVDSERDK